LCSKTFSLFFCLVQAKCKPKAKATHNN
jgi:hypothetical protein